MKAHYNSMRSQRRLHHNSMRSHLNSMQPINRSHLNSMWPINSMRLTSYEVNRDPDELDFLELSIRSIHSDQCVSRAVWLSETRDCTLKAADHPCMMHKANL